MIARSLCACVAFCLVAAMACADPVEATCPGSDRQLVAEGKLTIAADYSYPPFAFRGTDGDLTGFEVELMKEVAREMKLEATFVNRGAGALVTGLLAHRHDLAASGLRSTDELVEQACVSDAYLPADLGVLVTSPNADAYDRVRDLASKTVATLQGSRADDWALAELDDSTVASLPTTDDLLTALQQNRADVVVADLPFVEFSAVRSPELAVAMRIDLDESFVFAAAKDNGPLVAELNAALAKVKGSARFRELERRWFGD